MKCGCSPQRTSVLNCVYTRKLEGMELNLKILGPQKQFLCSTEEQQRTCNMNLVVLLSCRFLAGAWNFNTLILLEHVHVREGTHMTHMIIIWPTGECLAYDKRANVLKFPCLYFKNRVVTRCVVTIRVTAEIVTFCVQRLLHIVLNDCHILRQKLLHIALMLHFALIVTFCDVTLLLPI